MLQFLSFSVWSRWSVDPAPRPETTWASRAAASCWPGLPPASTWAQDGPRPPYCICRWRRWRETPRARLPTSPYRRGAWIRGRLQPPTSSPLHPCRVRGRLHGPHVRRRPASSRSERSVQRTRPGCRLLICRGSSGPGPPWPLPSRRRGHRFQQHGVHRGQGPPI